MANANGCELIVHRDPDDYKTQPTGNAGPGLSCAVIIKNYYLLIQASTFCFYLGITYKRQFAVNIPIGVKTDNGHEFYLKRNCSISPIKLAIIFTLLGIISIFIGIIFYSFGATLILPFSCLEVIALVAGYFYNALHANDYERLRVDSKNIYFESKFGLEYCEENFLKSLTRVLPSDQSNLIKLSQGQRNIHFGKNLHARLRSFLEIEIRQALRS